MRTRRGLCYPKLTNTSTITTTSLSFPLHNKKKRNYIDTNITCPVTCPVQLRELQSYQNYPTSFNKTEKVETILPSRKKSKISLPLDNYDEKSPDLFDVLPDDIVISILAKLSHSASCPADFINVLVTCKRLNGLAMNSIVLSKATSKIYEVKAEKWCESAHKFIKFCSDSGNVDASYTLGMIRFYCLENRGSGASLMAKAAINSHAQALYSLAVIQFNGSGGTKTDKDLRAGVALCARAAFLGHVDALRELGHCLQDGYGVRQNISEGRRFLVMANAREMSTSSVSCPKNWNNMKLLSDFGCDVAGGVVHHHVNGFMRDWFESGRVVIEAGLRMCSYEGCGRVESRKHEFRRCSVCGVVNYCSRACQALDWKVRHKSECVPMPRWDGVEFDVVDGDGVIHGMEVDEVEVEVEAGDI